MALLTETMRSSIKHQLIYALGIFTTKAVAILMLPVFTYHLIPADYARLDIIQTLANLAGIIVAFGLADSLFRFAGETSDRAKQRSIAANTFGLAIIAMIAGTILSQLIAPYVAEVLPGQITLFQTRVILLSLSVTACILVPLSWLRMRGEAVKFFLASAGWSILQAAATAVALFAGYGIDGVLIAGLVCSIGLAIVLTINQLQTTGASFHFSQLKDQARFGAVLVIAGIATFVVESSGRWILADEAGVVALAEFALAWKVGIMAMLLCEPFAMWWMPKRFAVLIEEGHAKYIQLTEIGISFALLCVLGITAIGAFTVQLLSPQEYHGAVKFIPAIAMLAGIKAITNLIATGVLSEKRTVWPIYIDISAAALALGANFFLIPIYGIWGAIIALACALSLRLMMYLIIGQNTQYLPYHSGRIALQLAITITTCVACSLTASPLATLVTGATGGIAILLTIVLSNLALLQKAQRVTKDSQQASITKTSTLKGNEPCH